MSTNWGLQQIRDNSSRCRQSAYTAGLNFGTGDFTVEVATTVKKWLGWSGNSGGGYLPFSYGFLGRNTPDGQVVYGSGSGWAIGNSAGGPWMPLFAIGNGVTTARATAPNNTDPVWRFAANHTMVHIAGVRKGAFVYLFVNGKWIATDSSSAVINIDGGTPKLYHGGGDSMSITHYIRISNVARTQEWLYANHENKRYLDANVVALWNFTTENGLGTVVTDTSGNGYDMSTTAGTSTGSWVALENIYTNKQGQKIAISESLDAVEATPSWFTVASWTQGSPSALKFTVNDSASAFYNNIVTASSALRIPGVITAANGDTVAAKSWAANVTTVTMTTTSIAQPGTAGQEILRVYG